MLPPFDWSKPDYLPIFRERIRRLNHIRANPQILPALRKFYQANPIKFIEDWGVTYDPRNVGTPLPTVMPFVLFDAQRDWLAWALDIAATGQDGITPKSRDMGASWLAIALSCTECLFNEGMAISFGSATEKKVDQIGNPDCLLWKARFFISRLPPEFRGSWDEKKHAPYMRIIFPDSEAVIIGEAGDNIGRGGRTKKTYLDEHAHLEHPLIIEASMSATTNTRIYISSINGPASLFTQKWESGQIPVKVLHWRDDPRKNAEWYERLKAKFDAVTIAQEYDINPRAAAEGILIPSAWVQACVGACEKLGIKPSGVKLVALDVADQGIDMNAACSRYGVSVEAVEEWSGKGSDIFKTTARAVGVCDSLQTRELRYDADGLGAGVRGDATQINADRKKAGKAEISTLAFRGSGEIVDPDKEMVKGRTNKDLFANAKAQGWWSLRVRAQNTYRAVVEGMPFDPDAILDLPSQPKLLAELSQPTYSLNTAGKILVDKAPDGTRSPNLADAVMIAFAPLKTKPKGFFDL